MRNFSEIYEEIKLRFEESGLSTAELAAKSGVPEINIKRFLIEMPKNPSFLGLSPVINALGMSVDALCGFTHEHREKSEKLHHIDSILLAELKAEKRRAIAEKHIAIIMCCALVVFIIGFLIYDITHPGIGYLRA